MVCSCKSDGAVSVQHVAMHKNVFSMFCRVDVRGSTVGGPSRVCIGNDGSGTCLTNLIDSLEYPYIVEVSVRVTFRLGLAITKPFICGLNVIPGSCSRSIVVVGLGSTGCLFRATGG